MKCVFVFTVLALFAGASAAVPSLGTVFNAAELLDILPVPGGLLFTVANLLKDFLTCLGNALNLNIVDKLFQCTGVLSRDDIKGALSKLCSGTLLSPQTASLTCVLNGVSLPAATNAASLTSCLSKLTSAANSVPGASTLLSLINLISLP